LTHLRDREEENQNVHGHIHTSVSVRLNVDVNAMIFLLAHRAIPTLPKEVLWTAHERQYKEAAEKCCCYETDKYVALDLE
jgi:hypothetical protein